MHAPGHTVQLFDDGVSRGCAVADLLCECVAEESSLLAIISAPNWQMAARRCSRLGISITGTIESGLLTVLDAADVRRQLIRSEVLDRGAFEALVSSLVRRLSSGRRPLRVYGEVVDVMASAGDFRGAIALEALWNELCAQIPFDLLCGYSSVAFGNPTSGPALRAICAAHGRVRADPGDVLGSFLIGATRPSQRPMPAQVGVRLRCG